MTPSRCPHGRTEACYPPAESELAWFFTDEEGAVLPREPRALRRRRGTPFRRSLAGMIRDRKDRG